MNKIELVDNSDVVNSNWYVCIKSNFKNKLYLHVTMDEIEQRLIQFIGLVHVCLHIFITKARVPILESIVISCFIEDHRNWWFTWVPFRRWHCQLRDNLWLRRTWYRFRIYFAVSKKTAYSHLQHGSHNLNVISCKYLGNWLIIYASFLLIPESVITKQYLSP